MSDAIQPHKAVALAVLIGCGLFLAMAGYVIYRIYTSFQDTGIPVWSEGKVVATLDPALTVCGLAVVAASAAGLTAWRTWRLIRSGKKSRASEL